ncbi:MAG: hypothetical protein WAV07_10030 [Candidatus Contendobacter sp.]
MSTKRISAILTVLSVFLFTSLVAHKVHAATYSFTTFDVPGATFGTFPSSINASGQVAGFYSDGSGGHGFVYSNGTFTTLDVPGATSTWAVSINASGQVAGDYSANWRQHSFVYSGGTFTTLDVPNAVRTDAKSINASGQVTGSYYDGSHFHGFLYSNGTFTTLDVPGAAGGIYPNSINDSGQVAGTYCNVASSRGSQDCHGFIYSGGTFTTLDVPGGIATSATSINASGQVAGTYRDARYHGFVYSGGTFTTLDVPGTTAPEPVSINDSGQVTGRYWDGSSFHGFIATPVCVAPTVAIHTLTTAPRGGFRITGSIILDSIPLCALVLANGQFMFTCGDALPKGDFDLTVPPDDQGQITLFGFSSGLAPFQQTLGPGALPASVNGNGCVTPTVTSTVTAAPRGGFRITGSITLDGTPLCALILANGQFLFTCGDALPKGEFDLTAPLDDQGQITLFGFSSGLAPFQQTFSP